MRFVRETGGADTPRNAADKPFCVSGRPVAPWQTSHAPVSGCRKKDRPCEDIMREKLTVERLKEVLSYDPDVGDFFWLSDVHPKYIGRKAGGFNAKMYWMIRIDGRKYMAHRLAWLWVHGSWPNQQIDHINGVKHDNKIANLRDVSNSINNQNKRKPMKGTKVGLLGVSMKKGRFVAQIGVNGRCTYLGSFSSAEEAHAAYIIAKRAHHPGNTL